MIFTEVLTNIFFENNYIPPFLFKENSKLLSSKWHARNFTLLKFHQTPSTSMKDILQNQNFYFVPSTTTIFDIRSTLYQAGK